MAVWLHPRLAQGSPFFFQPAFLLRCVRVGVCVCVTWRRFKGFCLPTRWQGVGLTLQGSHQPQTSPTKDLSPKALVFRGGVRIIRTKNLLYACKYTYIYIHTYMDVLWK